MILLELFENGTHLLSEAKPADTKSMWEKVIRAFKSKENVPQLDNYWPDITLDDIALDITTEIFDSVGPKYLIWAVKQYTTDPHFPLADLPQWKDTLTQFATIANDKRVQIEKDINKYPNIGELRNAIRAAVGTQQELGTTFFSKAVAGLEPFVKDAQASWVYKGSDYAIYYPKTYESSGVLKDNLIGSVSVCTVMNKTYFDSYTNNGTLLYILGQDKMYNCFINTAPNTRGRRGHGEKSEFADQHNDHTITLDFLLQNFPKLLAPVLKIINENTSPDVIQPLVTAGVDYAALPMGILVNNVFGDHNVILPPVAISKSIDFLKECAKFNFVESLKRGVIEIDGDHWGELCRYVFEAKPSELVAAIFKYQYAKAFDKMPDDLQNNYLLLKQCAQRNFKLICQYDIITPKNKHYDSLCRYAIELNPVNIVYIKDTPYIFREFEQNQQYMMALEQYITEDPAILAEVEDYDNPALSFDILEYAITNAPDMNVFKYFSDAHPHHPQYLELCKIALDVDDRNIINVATEYRDVLLKQFPEIEEKYIISTPVETVQKLLSQVAGIIEENFIAEILDEWKQDDMDDYNDYLRDQGYIDDDGEIDWDEVHANNEEWLDWNDSARNWVDTLQKLIRPNANKFLQFVRLDYMGGLRPVSEFEYAFADFIYGEADRDFRYSNALYNFIKTDIILSPERDGYVAMYKQS